MCGMCGMVMLTLFAAAPIARGSGLNFLNYLGDSVNWGKEFPRCMKDLESLAEALTKREKWALKMVDATTKIPPGILTGNLVDFGNFDECVSARPIGTDLAPQHCMASLRFPVPSNLTKEDNSSLKIPIVYRWSYCVPESCSATAVETILRYGLGQFPVDVNVTVLPSDCQTGRGYSLSAADLLGISIWCGFALLAVASTIYDVTVTVLAKEPNPWLTSFSVYSNMKRLMDTKISTETLAPLNGIRFLSIAWIVLGHRFYFTSMTSIMNLTEVPHEFEKIYFQIFAGGVLAVDTFFLLSGLLNSYFLLKLLDKTKKFPTGSFYIHRYLRTTPVLAAVVLMYSTWFALLGNGPGWSRMTSYSRQLCVDYWWPTLLYINNYYNPVNQCAGQSWYLAVDMQLYWISPLIILPIWKWPKIAKYYLFLLLGLSVAGQFIVAYVYKFRMAFNISLDLEESKRVTELLYVPTHTRATTYIIGIMLGVYLNGIRNLPEKPKLSKAAVLFGWLLSATVCLSVLFGNYPFFRSEENHPYNRLESSLYIGIHRLGWGIGISWIILACLFGYGGIVNSILSWRFFVPLSRLTYCIFLCHMGIQQYQLGTMRTTGYYQMFDEIHRYFGDLVLSIFGALFLSLLFESPVMTLERLVLRKQNQMKKDLQSYTNKAFQEA